MSRAREIVLLVAHLLAPINFVWPKIDNFPPSSLCPFGHNLQAEEWAENWQQKSSWPPSGHLGSELSRSLAGRACDLGARKKCLDLSLASTLGLIWLRPGRASERPGELANQRAPISDSGQLSAGCGRASVVCVFARCGDRFLQRQRAALGRTHTLADWDGRLRASGRARGTSALHESRSLSFGILRAARTK